MPAAAAAAGQALSDTEGNDEGSDTEGDDQGWNDTVRTADVFFRQEGDHDFSSGEESPEDLDSDQDFGFLCEPGPAAGIQEEATAPVKILQTHDWMPVPGSYGTLAVLPPKPGGAHLESYVFVHEMANLYDPHNFARTFSEDIEKLFCGGNIVDALTKDERKVRVMNRNVFRANKLLACIRRSQRKLKPVVDLLDADSLTRYVGLD